MDGGKGNEIQKIGGNMMNKLAEENPLSGEKIEAGDQLGLEQLDVDSKNGSNSDSNEDVMRPYFYSPPLHHSPQHLPGMHLPNNVLYSHIDQNIDTGRASDLLMAVSVCAENNKMKIMELAASAMAELSRMAVEGEPLWRRGEDGETEVLNGVEYMNEFEPAEAALKEIMRIVEVGEVRELPLLDPAAEFLSAYQPVLPKSKPLRTEASRDTGFVGINAVSVVELLMDLKQWSLMFPNIVSRGTILGVIAAGVKSYNGALQVMTAEFHFPTPLVPARESHFARYCKQLSGGTWGVVDVSLETVFPCPVIRFRRRPSGCLIQQMPNGTSKVTWVEHVEVENKPIHNIYEPIVISGFAFSAKRWVRSLVRQCERFAALMAKSTPTHDGVLLPQAGRASMLKLAERMLRTFCHEVCGSSVNMWMSLPVDGAENARVMTSYSMDDPGKPPGTSIVFTTSLCLPTSPRRLFNFLRHHNSRHKWDILSYRHVIEELAYVTSGEDPGNRVSIQEVNAAHKQIEILYLQESYFDTTGSYVIYAPIDIFAMSMILSGGNPDYVAVLPSGFAILPDKPPATAATRGDQEVDGSILTIAFHIMDNQSTQDYISPESVVKIQRVIKDTVVAIKTVVRSNNLLGNWPTE